METHGKLVSRSASDEIEDSYAEGRRRAAIVVNRLRKNGDEVGGNLCCQVAMRLPRKALAGFFSEIERAIAGPD